MNMIMKTNVNTNMNVNALANMSCMATLGFRNYVCIHNSCMWYWLPVVRALTDLKGAKLKNDKKVTLCAKCALLSNQVTSLLCGPLLPYK